MISFKSAIEGVLVRRIRSGEETREEGRKYPALFKCAQITKHLLVSRIEIGVSAFRDYYRISPFY